MKSSTFIVSRSVMISLLILISLGMVSWGCKKDNPVQEPVPSIQLTAKQQALVYAGNDFGFNMLKEISIKKDQENFCISPLSISAALGMTMNGAGGTTRTAMEDVLGFSGMTNQEINETYKILLDYLMKCDPKVVMEIANSIWHRDDFPVLPLFIQVNQQYFYAGVYSVDFDDPATLAAINQWVSNNTQGKIPTILQAIPAQTVMYLINAVYFKAAWKYKFDKQLTQQAPFTLQNGSQVMVDMMKQDGSIDLMVNSLCQAVRLPYGKGNYEMVAMIPNPGYTIQDVTAVLNQGVWQDWLGSFQQAGSATLYYPKYRFAFEEKLNDMLSDLGMDIAFAPGMADFSGINPDYELYISEVKHKTYIDVNEEGTEAAAVTSVGISYTSVGPIISFDRPFLFFILEKNSGFVTFSGQVVQPVY